MTDDIKYDFPTLHRPVSPEDTQLTNPYLYKPVKPIPTPPHKPLDQQNFRPRTGGERAFTFPTIPTEANWRAYRAKKTYEDLTEEDEFERCYQELASRKAYRHPHPGGPASREGALGGTWRHMKEAIGYGPGRLMWVDGVVTLYDGAVLNNERPWSQCARNQPKSQAEISYMPINRGPIATSATNIPKIQDSNWYTVNSPQPLPFARGAPNQQGFNDNRRKGFYQLSQVYTK